MANRYRRARAIGKEQFEAQIEKDKVLLQTFGLELLDVSGGLTVAFKGEVRGRINPWNCTTIDLKLFEWLEPLLKELIECKNTAPTG